MDKHLSETIANVKFILIILVVALHSVTNSKMINLEEVSGSLWLYKAIRVYIGNILGTMAIPMFFFLSGYLFFCNIEKWTIKLFQQKMVRRISSLLIPYIIWNSLAALFFLISKHQGEWSLSILWNDFQRIGSWHIYWDAHQGSQLRPIDFPLWYMRDLMILGMFTPLIYHLNNLCRWYWIIMIWLLTNYLDKIPYITGFGVIYFLTFALGCYIGQTKQTLIINKRWVVLMSILSILISLCLFIFPKAPCIAWLKTLFIIMAGMSLINTIYILCKRGWLHTGWHSQSSFFIFALHIIGIRVWCDHIFNNLLPYTSHNGWLLLLRFTVSLALTVLSCMIIYKILEYIWPKFLKFLCGR